MAYTKDGIMAQVYVAFGQGTGMFRVAQDACTALHDRYYDKITEDVINIHWETQAVQVLERIRALGRLMANEATLAGSTVITGAGLPAAAQKIESTSDTALCGPPPPPDSDG